MSLGWAKKHATTLVLAALAAGAVTWVVMDRGSVSTNEAEKRKRNLIPAWRGDEVTRLEIELPEKPYVLERPKEGEERNWTLTVGGDAMPAEDQSVDKLLGSFEYAEFQREVPPSSVDRAAFGLDAPVARFRIQMGELKYELAVGGDAAGSPDQKYVEVVGRGVYVVNASLVAALSRPAEEVRARDVMPYLSTDLQGLVLEGKGGTRKFERAPWSGGRGSGFRFAEGSEGPIGRRVDGTRLDQVFVAFGRMQAETFVDAAKAATASRADVTVTMIPKHGRSGVLVVGGDCPGKEGLTLVRRTEPSPLDVCVPSGVVGALFVPAKDFVDDGLVGASVDEIVEVDVRIGDKTFDLARNERGFKLRSPEQRDIPLDAGNRFLAGLVAARGEPLSEATGPTGDVVKVKVISQGGIDESGGLAERTEEIDIGPKDGDRRVAFRHEDGAAVSIGVDAALAFESAQLLLLDRHVMTFRRPAVASFTIERGELRQELTRNGSDFDFASPKGEGLLVDQAWATEALDALSALTAERFVAEKADASFGLEPPRAKIVIELDASSATPKQTLTLLLGNATDDGPYAQLAGKPEVFIAPGPVASLASRLFVSRASFSVRPSELERLVLRSSGKTSTLVRDGSRLIVEGHPADAAASEISQAIDDLVALEAVSVGAAKPEHGLEAATLTITVTPRRTTDDVAAPKPVTLTFGASDTLRGEGIRYARRSDVDATFAVSAGAVRRVMAAFGAE
jgi:hypothetical protein